MRVGDGSEILGHRLNARKLALEAGEVSYVVVEPELELPATVEANQHANVPVAIF